MQAVDERFMSEALELAQLGRGSTSPNPMVGALVVKDGAIVGSGCHLLAGGPHAEVVALDAAGERARGATLYVTLEPCCHTGRTPPCTQRIIASGVKRVVAAMTDPNLQVKGQGLAQLQAAGIEVKTDVLHHAAARLNEAFIKYMTHHLPFVTLKAAMTLDGKIATRTGASRWISGESSRRFGHRLRHESDAIMVGIGTLLADDPRLTTRLPEGGKDSLRVIVDSHARTPAHAKVVRERPENTLIVTTACAAPERVEALRYQGVDVVMLGADDQRQVPLDEMMSHLAQRDVTSLLVEGGSRLNYSLLEAGLVDKVHFFLAPMLIGGECAPTPVGGAGKANIEEAWQLGDSTVERLGPDVLITAYVNYGP